MRDVTDQQIAEDVEAYLREHEADVPELGWHRLEAVLRKLPYYSEIRDYSTIAIIQSLKSLSADLEIKYHRVRLTRAEPYPIEVTPAQRDLLVAVWQCGKHTVPTTLDNVAQILNRTSTTVRGRCKDSGELVSLDAGLIKQLVPDDHPLWVKTDQKSGYLTTLLREVEKKQSGGDVTVPGDVIDEYKAMLVTLQDDITYHELRLIQLQQRKAEILAKIR